MENFNKQSADLKSSGSANSHERAFQESPVIKKGGMNAPQSRHGRFKSVERSPAAQQMTSQPSETSSILQKMKSRLQIHNNQKVGGGIENEDDQQHYQTMFSHYNDLEFAKRKRFDFVQSSFLGQKHLKIAVNNEKKRVMANGRKLSNFMPHD